MKKTLLPLSLVMLLGASMQAQAADVDYVQIPSEGGAPSIQFMNVLYTYFSTQSLIPASYFENNTDGFTFNSIGFTVEQNPAQKTLPNETLTVTVSLAETDRTAPYVNGESIVPESEFKQVYIGEFAGEEVDGKYLINFPLAEAFTVAAGKGLAVNISFAGTKDMIYSKMNTYCAGEDSYFVYMYADASETDASVYTKSFAGKGMPVFTFGVGEAETPVENAFEIDITSATATRLSATEGEISASYEVTKEENVEGYHFFVVRAPREGETGDQVLGSYDVKAGVRGEVTIPLTLDQDGEFTTYVKCNAIYKDGTESQPYQYSKGAVYVPAWVANAFDVEITHVHAIRISATQAEVSVTYNVTKEENVEGYKFEVVDSEGSVLGEEAVKAGAKSEASIALTLPENNDAVDTKVKMWAVYTDGTASDVTTYDVTVPEYISGATGVDIVTSENGEAVYYNLQGARVANPENGLFIRVVNGKAAKVMVK